MISTIFTVQQSEQMKEKDKRIKLMSEILNGIKVLKLYAWEESFTKIISGIRKEELTLLRRAGFTNAASSFFWQLAPFMVRFKNYISPFNKLLTLIYIYVGLLSHILDKSGSIIIYPQPCL